MQKTHFELPSRERLRNRLCKDAVVFDEAPSNKIEEKSKLGAANAKRLCLRYCGAWMSLLHSIR